MFALFNSQTMAQLKGETPSSFGSCTVKPAKCGGDHREKESLFHSLIKQFRRILPWSTAQSELPMLQLSEAFRDQPKTAPRTLAYSTRVTWNGQWLWQLHTISSSSDVQHQGFSSSAGEMHPLLPFLGKAAGNPILALGQLA